MELNEEQKQSVRQWVAAGAGLSEVQKRLNEEFKLSMTYMDVRVLVIDLGVDVKDKPSSRPRPPLVDGDALDGAPAPGGGLGGVSVEVDRVTKPGAVVSGTVSFSDGTNASWVLDQMGRLALDAGDPGYRPSPEDLRMFQDELRAALEKRGF